MGIETTGAARLEVARLRAGEPWFPAAFAALEAIMAGRSEDWPAIDPFFYGRWDPAVEAYAAAHASHQNSAAIAALNAEGAYDPDATRTALRTFEGPVLLLVGEVDLNTPPSIAEEVAALFANVEYVVQPGAGHFPWIDDPERFTATVSAFFA